MNELFSKLRRNAAESVVGQPKDARNLLTRLLAGPQNMDVVEDRERIRQHQEQSASDAAARKEERRLLQAQKTQEFCAEIGISGQSLDAAGAYHLFPDLYSLTDEGFTSESIVKATEVSKFVLGQLWKDGVAISLPPTDGSQPNEWHQTVSWETQQVSPEIAAAKITQRHEVDDSDAGLGMGTLNNFSTSLELSLPDGTAAENWIQGKISQLDAALKKDPAIQNVAWEPTSDKLNFHKLYKFTYQLDQGGVHTVNVSVATVKNPEGNGAPSTPKVIIEVNELRGRSENVLSDKAAEIVTQKAFKIFSDALAAVK